MGNYALVADVQGHKISGSVVDLTDYTDPQIESSIALSEEKIEGYTGDIFYVSTATHSFDGNGLTKLFFVPTISHRLISVTSVKDFDIDGTTLLDTYVENDDFKMYEYYLETARSFSGDSPRRRFGTGGVWPKGQKNIAIEGTWGRSSVPEAVKRSTILLSLEDLSPGCTRMSPDGISEAEWPDFRIKFGTSDRDRGRSTGFLAVDNLLFDHVNNVGIFTNVIPNERQTYDNTLVTE